MFLQKLNDLKLKITELEELAEKDIPEEIQKEVVDSIQSLRDIINRIGTTVEKHFHDEKVLKNMEKDIHHRMANEELYLTIPKEKHHQIIEKIIEDPEINLLTEKELQNFVEDRLKNAGTEELITKAYSKQDIINLGDAVADRDSSETVKYEAGLDVLKGMVETPSGRDDALTHGLTRIMADPKTRAHYLYLYYDIV